MASSVLVSNPARGETEAWDKRVHHLLPVVLFSGARGPHHALRPRAPEVAKRPGPHPLGPRSRSVRDPAQGCEATETLQPTNNSP